MCEFFSAFWPNLAATTISIVAAYFIYYLGRSQYRREKKEFENKKFEYFQYLLQNAINTIERNTKLLQENINTLTNYIYEIPPLEQNVNGDMRRIMHDVNLEEIFHLYLKLFPKSSNIKDFHEIISKLDYFEEKTKLLRKTFQHAMKNDYARRIDFNNSFIKAANRIDEIINLFNQAGNDIEALRISNILNNFKSREKENQSNLEYHCKNLILPIHEILQKYISGNPLLKNLIFDFESAIFKYNMIIKGNRHFKSELEEDERQLNDCLMRLKEKTKPILEYKNKQGRK